jgi:hypothetical protein
MNNDTNFKNEGTASSAKTENHWLFELGDNRQQSLELASRPEIYKELKDDPFGEDSDIIRLSSIMLELAIDDILLENVYDDVDKQNKLKEYSSEAFRLLRVLPLLKNKLVDGECLLRTGVFAILGDVGLDAEKWFRETKCPDLPLDAEHWEDRVRATVLDIWIRLLWHRERSGLDESLNRIKQLRKDQTSFERDYLKKYSRTCKKDRIIELISLYHLAKAAEIFSVYIINDMNGDKHQIYQSLDEHFSQVVGSVNTDVLSRLLKAATYKIMENSITNEEDNKLRKG